MSDPMQIDFPIGKNSTARAMLGAATQILNAVSGSGFGGGGRPPSGGPVTVQRDFVGTDSRFRSRMGSRTLTKQKKRQMRRVRALKRIRKFKKRRFRRAVKRVISKNFSLRFSHTWTRGWCSGFNKQAVAFIPIFSYRGGTVLQQPTPSSASGASLIGDYTGFPGHAAYIKQALDDEVFYPNGSTTNTVQNNWWFKVQKATLDMTMTNVGSNSEQHNIPGSDPPATAGCARVIEYELYYVTFRKTSAPNQTSFFSQVNIEDYADNYAQGLGSNANDPVQLNDFDWVPYLNPYTRMYAKYKLIGRGYLGTANPQRFNFSYKPKLLFNKKQWEMDSSDDYMNHTFKPKGTAAIMVVWRGTPSTIVGPGTGIGPTRLHFHCNQRMWVSTHSTGQQGQKSTLQMPSDFQ